MSIMRQTRVEFRRPDSTTDEELRRMNTAEQAHVCYARGSLEKMSDRAAVLIAGVG